MRDAILTIWKSGRIFIIAVLAFIIFRLMLFFTLSLTFLNPVSTAWKEFSMTDFYYKSKTTPIPSTLITIVDMTELISRADLAMALEDIERLEPKVIGVDMVFKGLKPDTIGDQMIAQVAATYPNIIWSLKLCDYENDELGFVTPYRSFFVEQTGAREGVTNMQSSQYTHVKRDIVLGWRLNGEVKPSFVGEVTNAYADKELVPVAEKDLAINFTPTDFAVVPWNEVSLHPELITDRIVLFGPMYDEVDMHYTPIDKMAGTKLLAYAIQTFLRKSEVKEIGQPLLGIISILIIMLTFWLRVKRRNWAEHHTGMALFFGFPIVSSIISFVWLAFLTYLSFIIFNKFNISFNLVYAFSSIAFLGTAEASYKSILEHLTKKTNEIQDK